MSSRAAVCLAGTRSSVESIVTRLHTAGFAYNDISVVLPDNAGWRSVAMDKQSKAPEGAATGASVGGVAGGTLGFLAGIGSLAIPGVGPFIAAGPILGMLSGAAVGATLGGVTGGLVGMGMPEYIAKAYDGKLREGRALISVHADESDELDLAKEIMKSEGAESIGVTEEKSAKGK